MYSPYGLLLNGDASITPFLFNGMYGVMTDDNGLYYMRARYYSPEIRRFVNQDILLGDIFDGQTLNRYAFVTGNPLNRIDPTGLLAWMVIPAICTGGGCEVIIFAVVGGSIWWAANSNNDNSLNDEESCNCGSDISPPPPPDPCEQFPEFCSSEQVLFDNQYPSDPMRPITRYEVVFRDGKWYTINSNGVVRSASGRYNFVVQDGRIYVSRYGGHIDIAGGKKVQYAGEIQFSGRTTRGSLRWWNNYSGHYRPFSNCANQAKLPLDKFIPRF